MIRYLLLAANILVWGCLAWLGRDDTGAHFVYYEVIPVALLMAGALPPLVLWKLDLVRFGTWWSIAVLCAVLPYLFFYTGGM